MRTSRKRERQAVVEQQKRSEADQRQLQRTIRQAVEEISSALGETEGGAKDIVQRSVTLLGIERAQALRQETEQIEARGGMQTIDGSRRRTPGGVYMYLLKQRLTEAGQKDLAKKILGK